MYSVSILNQYLPPSGVYRYANDIHKSVKGSRLYTFLYGLHRSKLPQYSEGNYVEGRFNYLRKLNKLLPNYAHSDFIRELEKSDLHESLIHYASPMIPLKISPASGIVTIHDPPSILFDSDLFENGNNHGWNVIQSKYQKRYFNSFKKYSNVIAVSNYVKELLLQEGFEDNIKVVYPCISKTFKFQPAKKLIKEKLGIPMDKICVLSVSSNLKRKNLSVVRDTMELLGSKFKLIRIGASLTSNDLSFSNIDYEMLNLIYNACDVMLFPSLYEGFGNPLVEAFATGLPVVASDIEVFRETSGGNAAILVDPKDPASLASGVRTALESSDDLIRKGLKRAERFSFERFGREMNEYYNGIISSMN